MPSRIQLVKASGTITIKSDGTIDPPNAPISRTGTTYSLNDNITDSILVEKNNIIINGAGHTLQGSGSGRGIDLSRRSNVTVTTTRITNFSYGIWLEEFANNNTLHLNHIADGLIGISLDNSSYNIVTSNDLISNYEGILISTSSNHNTIIANNITNNNYGIFITSSTGNLIHHNNLIDNNQQAYTLDTTNTWDDGDQGNHWSDYSGTDTNSDGIGDTPYVIDSNNQDQRPLIRIIPEIPITIMIPLIITTTLAAALVTAKTHEKIIQRYIPRASVP